MAKTRLNTEEAFKNIMGGTSQITASPDADNLLQEKKRDQDKESEKPAKEKLVQTAFYITPKHHKALKIKSALGEGPESKDRSAIVRAALDMYLADTLKTL